MSAGEGRAGRSRGRARLDRGSAELGADQQLLVAGRNAVAEAIRAGIPASELLISEGLIAGGRVWGLRQVAEEHGIEVVLRPAAVIEQLCRGMHHQGVALRLLALPESPSLKQVLAQVAGRPCLLLLCDSILDPHNLGAIIRSALAAGADAVIVPRHGAAWVTPAVVAASAGAVFHLRPCRVGSMASALESIRQAGIWVVTADARAPICYDAVDLSGRVALVIGSEGRGVRPLLRRRSDFEVRIPTVGAVGDLNAAVAASILLFEAARQRRITTAGTGLAT